MNLGARIDELHELRTQKRVLEKELKDLEKTYSEKQLEVIDLMHAQGVTKMTGSSATVSIGTSIKPSVEDWDTFYEFIHRHKYYHLLERRPAVLACRELFETKGVIPGVVPFTKETLNLRDL
jgi:hypothetical protein